MPLNNTVPAVHEGWLTALQCTFIILCADISLPKISFQQLLIQYFFQSYKILIQVCNSRTSNCSKTSKKAFRILSRWKHMLLFLRTSLNSTCSFCNRWWEMPWLKLHSYICFSWRPLAQSMVPPCFELWICVFLDEPKNKYFRFFHPFWELE